MEKIVQQGILYDFYGELLTEHQKKVYESVVYENLSLGEIADDLGVSRQAVFDMIKRTDRILMDYESKLKLVNRFKTVRSRVDEMKKILKPSENKMPDDIGKDASLPDVQRDELIRLCDEIVEIL